MSSPGFYSPPPPGAARSNLPMLYYGLIVVGTASVVLALYNLLVLRWCADRRSRLPAGQNPLAEVAAARAGGNGGEEIPLPGSFKYKKEMSAGGEEDRHCECAVCLSGFEEGEEIRMLPRCRHAFHAQCIDMWLFSHADCPLCRTPLVAPRRCSRHVEAAAAAEGSPGEVLLGSGGDREKVGDD